MSSEMDFGCINDNCFSLLVHGGVCGMLCGACGVCGVCGVCHGVCGVRCMDRSRSSIQKMHDEMKGERLEVSDEW